MTSLHPVLLNVDDSQVTRYVRRRILERAGFQVREAADGRQALALVRERPDLVLLDVGLPDMSGFDVCRAIRNDSATTATPVLQISATFVSAADRKRALAGGADGYVIEPVDPEALVETIRSVLRVRAAAKTVRQKPLAGLRVLVVDDSTELLEMGRTALTLYGATVWTATSSKEALDLLDRHRPDVLVADLGLPPEDGYSLIQNIRLRPEEAGGRIPAIAWTGYVKEEDRLRSLRSGYQVHLAKPASVDDLVRTIAQLVGR